mgnify:CR=1 FL=1
MPARQPSARGGVTSSTPSRPSTTRNRFEIEPSDGIYEAKAQDAEVPESLDGADDADTSVGDLDAAFGRSEFTFETTCEIAGQHAAAMEPHATVAEWQDGELTIRMSVQILATARTAIARTLGIDEEKVRQAVYYGVPSHTRLRAVVWKLFLG